MKKKFFTKFFALFFLINVSLEAGINNYNISQEDRDLVIKRISSYDKDELIERKTFLLAQLEDDNQSIFNIDTNNQETKTETETEEDDDDELIYFEIDAINIALSIMPQTSDQFLDLIQMVVVSSQLLQLMVIIQLLLNWVMYIMMLVLQP